MGEWAGYGLSDFLMFSPQAYWRLVERFNLAYWPAHLLAVAAGLGALASARRAPRAGLVLLALAWAWVGWAFHWRHYAEIFLAAPAIALACGVQAVLLAVAAFHGRFEGNGHRAGLVIGLAAVLLYPLLAPVEGRPWRQAEVFGFLPDPTALATLGFLLACGLPRWQRAVLAVVPASSLLLGLLTRSQFP